MVDSYKQRTGNQSVHSLPFAAQPALHKPAPLEGRIARACFAGSWYGDRHVERGEAMKWLLRTAHKHGLDIFDRNHGSGLFPFPEEYREGIRGGLHYQDLCREYARYRLFLNVNSVTDSPTMFSRRVFELMACGTPVVSTPARGILELFQTDAVWVVQSEAEADEAIATLLNDDDEWRRRSLAGIRDVFARHTYARRVNEIFVKAGISDRIEVDPRVLLVGLAESQLQVERLVAFSECQSYRGFSLLIVASGLEVLPESRESVVFLHREELEQRLAAESETVGAIGWISPHHDYGAHYLQDLVNAMAYQSEAAGWAKSCDTDAFCFSEKTSLGAAIWRPTVFIDRWMQWRDISIYDSELFVADAEEFCLKASGDRPRGERNA